MPRTARYAPGGLVYHVLNRAVARLPLLERLAVASARWIEQVKKPQTEAEVKSLQHSFNRGTPFGNDVWVRQTAHRLGLESTLRPRGRPKKDGAA